MVGVRRRENIIVPSLQIADEVVEHGLLCRSKELMRLLRGGFPIDVGRGSEVRRIFAFQHGIGVNGTRDLVEPPSPAMEKMNESSLLA
jgi:hypothetical protein